MLKLVSSEKRNLNRSDHHNGPSLSLFTCKIEGHEFSCRLIDDTRLGTIVIAIKGDVPQIKTHVPLGLYKGQELVLDECWQIKSMRDEASEKIVVLEHESAQFLSLFETHLVNDYFTTKNKYAILRTNMPEGAEQLSWHLTEIKEALEAVRVKIHFDGQCLTGKFDFSSNQSSLERLDFELTGGAWVEGKTKTVFVEYFFLSARYVFKSNVIEYDQDFGILSVEIPEAFVSLSTRRYYRLKCRIPVMFKFQTGEAGEGIIDSISPNGLSIVVGEGNIDLSTSVVLECHGIDERILGYFFKRKDKTTVIFLPHDQGQSMGMYALYLKALPEDCTVRSKANYEKFLKLYAQVGWGKKSDSWAAESKNTWDYTDNLIMGNYLGGVDCQTAELLSGTGNLPLGDGFMYGHSSCMVKSLPAIRTFYKILAISFSSIDFFPHVRYYMGSFEKKSRFTTRLLMIFKPDASPRFHRVIHMNSVTIKDKLEQTNEDASLQEIPYDKLLELSLSKTMTFMLDAFGKPQQMLSLFKVRWFVLTHAGKNVAIVQKHESPQFLTASNLYNTYYIFKLDRSVSPDQVFSMIGSKLQFGDTPIQFICGEGNENDLEDVIQSLTSTPIFYTITHKDDVGNLLISLTRSIYNVVKKYGDDAIAEIRQLIA